MLRVIHTGIQVVNCKPSNPGRKTLVEPQLTPPVHRDEVAEPLVSKFVGDDICDPVTVAVCRRSWVK